MLQSRPIDFLKQILADFNDAVRPNPQEEFIESRMVQSTEGYAVNDDGFTLWFRVRNDVSCVEQFTMPESTKCALMSIGAKNTLTKCTLMQSAPGQRCDVLASCFSNPHPAAPRVRKDVGLSEVVNRHRKGQSLWGVMYHIYGPHGQISTRDYSMAIYQWKWTVHCEPKADVVRVQGIRASISVSKQIVWAYCIVIRALGRCRNGERHLHESRFEDSLGPKYWYASPVDFEPLGEDFSRKIFIMNGDLPG